MLWTCVSNVYDAFSAFVLFDFDFSVCELLVWCGICLFHCVLCVLLNGELRPGGCLTAFDY